MWIRGDSMLAFPTIITLHAIRMGLLARLGADAPMRIKLIVCTSLAMWAGVLICGRTLTWCGHPPFITDQPDALLAI
jgi:hypothetical protein